MSKSILIIDTPENCYNCGIRKGYFCGGIGGMFGKSLPTDLRKPAWCPLKIKLQKNSTNLIRLNEEIDRFIDAAHENYLKLENDKDKAAIDGEIKAYWNLKNLVEEFLEAEEE